MLLNNRADTEEQPRNSFASDTLSALNIACTQDAAIVQVPAGVTIDQPLQVVFYSTSQAATSHFAAYPKLVVDVAANACVHIKQTFVGGAGSSSEVPPAAAATAAAAAAAATEEANDTGGLLVVSQSRFRVASGGRVVHTYEQDLGLSSRHLEVISSDVQGGGR